MARGLASVINVLDPDVIVLGGGMSNIERLYENVPRLWTEHVFACGASRHTSPADRKGRPQPDGVERAWCARRTALPAVSASSVRYGRCAGPT